MFQPHRVCIAYRVDTGDLAYVPVTINCKNGLVMENYIEIYPSRRIRAIKRNVRDIIDELKAQDNLRFSIYVWDYKKIGESRIFIELYGRGFIIETPPDLLITGRCRHDFYVGTDGVPRYDGVKVRFLELNRKELLALML